MLKIFSIKDTKADAFMTPFFTHNRATAERDFRRAASDGQSHLFHSVGDFELYEVGIWNDEVGVILTGDAPVLVCKGAELGRPVALTQDQVDAVDGPVRSALKLAEGR